MSDGDPDIGPHFLLTIQAHALSADHSVPLGRNPACFRIVYAAGRDISSYRVGEHGALRQGSGADIPLRGSVGPHHYKPRAREHEMTTIPANLLSSSFLMYPLAAIAVVVTVCVFFIVRRRMR